MRRTNPFEPIEPAEPLSRAIKEQYASWAKPCPPYFPRTLSQKFDFGYNRITEIPIDY